ncbi:unnamed protein product [marine sediment metagenome]|uniref:Methyltransferase domain-containing protein n=1 Tax=marine sediment metagenome TaxID=412755 RepID=X1AA44_9ZZZZ
MFKLKKFISKKLPIYVEINLNSFDERIKYYFYNIASRLPLSLQKILFYWEVIRNVINPTSNSIIDIGCGKGIIMSYLKKFDNKYKSIGIDVYKPYVEFCLYKKIYDEVYLYDIRKIWSPALIINSPLNQVIEMQPTKRIRKILKIVFF